MNRDNLIHGTGGISLGLLVLTPMIRHFADASLWIYGLFLAILLITIGLRCSVLRFQYAQAMWILTLAVFFSWNIAIIAFQGAAEGQLVQTFNLVTVLTLAILASLSWAEIFYRTFYRVQLVGVTLVSGLVLFGAVTAGGDYRDFWGDQYLMIGTTISIGYCLLLPKVVASSGRELLGWGMLLALFGTGIALGQARGAVVFSLFFTAMVAALYWPRPYSAFSKAKTLLGRFGVLLTGAVIVYLIMPERQVKRMVRLIEGREFERTRFQLWQDAWESISQYPIVGQNFGISTVDHYPHNLFLQVGLDSGLIGVLFMAVMLLLPVAYFILYRRCTNQINKPEAWGLLGTYLILIMDYSKSYNFYSARVLFIFGGLLVGYVAYQLRTKKRIPFQSNY